MVIAIDKESGRKKWDFLLPAGAGVCAPIITSGGNIIIPAIGSIYALSQNTGDLKWNFKHRGGYNYKAGPLSAAVGDNGNIYFGSSDRFIYAIEGKTGNKVWTVRTGAPVVSAPLISNDGTLYIGSDDGRLYAIATGSSGPAKSPWPMYGQNAQRTNRAPAAK